MKTKLFILIFMTVFLLVEVSFAGPYAPAAGQSGSSAIHMDDDSFLAWATGYENYNAGTNVDDTWKTPTKAIGKAEGTSYDIVSLGRHGSITLTFDSPIVNGTDADFAVFENSFSDTFLELGYVEVSSNGTDFFRFTNSSLTSNPVGGFGTVDPTNIWGLAGKYRQGYGTTFDLDWLPSNLQLDINNINYVKIVDIVGDGSDLDSNNNKIYDPYPTFGSAGFDLDAIGVLHQGSSPVPLPGALWLLGSGLIGLTAIKKKLCYIMHFFFMLFHTACFSSGFHKGNTAV